jgi:hypothetical protein
LLTGTDRVVSFCVPMSKLDKAPAIFCPAFFCDLQPAPTLDQTPGFDIGKDLKRGFREIA